MFQRHGVIEAANLDEAVAITAVLATCPFPRGRRVGIVTASGGGGGGSPELATAGGRDVEAIDPALERLGELLRAS